MIHAPQVKSGGRKSMLIGIADPLYLKDHEMEARKLQAEVVAQAASSLVRSLSRAIGKWIHRVGPRLKVAANKRHLSTHESVESS